MPKAIERRLKKQARKQHLTGDSLNAYVYGTLRKKFGWKPKRELKKHGK